jgi:SAM-dependent methyltransferase
VSANPLRHHAFTAERYRRTLAALGDLRGKRVLDYGAGDGALTGWIAKRVGAAGEAHGYDPNPQAVELARYMLDKHRLRATIHADLAELPNDYFDAVVCAEVIEHVHDVDGLLREIARVLKPGGAAIITTPVRLTEVPEDPNHVREWFPDEFVALLERGPLGLVRHEQFIPAAAPEVYFWRSPLLLRVPVFRLICNLLSIGGVDALSFLGVRPRLFMTQSALLHKPSG